MQVAAPKTVQAERSHFHHRHHHSPLDSYEDRVCLAHVAMMTFGLVALLGAWHDPVQGLCFVASVCALMIFGALLLTDSRIAARPAFTPSHCAIARAREDVAPERTLHWYSCANHLGVPPPQALGSFFRGNTEHCPNQFGIASFLFSVSYVS